MARYIEKDLEKADHIALVQTDLMQVIAILEEIDSNSKAYDFNDLVGGELISKLITYFDKCDEPLLKLWRINSGNSNK
tara:strand:+ start:574 stop:807 length:234 start_codon:yes stop_codon:yes gene_type:complete